MTPHGQDGTVTNAEAPTPRRPPGFDCRGRPGGAVPFRGNDRPDPWDLG